MIQNTPKSEYQSAPRDFVFLYFYDIWETRDVCIRVCMRVYVSCYVEFSRRTSSKLSVPNVPTADKILLSARSPNFVQQRGLTRFQFVARRQVRRGIPNQLKRVT